jgi:hypothetical protein
MLTLPVSVESLMLPHSICSFATLIAVVTFSASTAALGADSGRWAGTWAAAAQPFMPGALETYAHQTLRLIVHTSVGGSQVRVTLSNLYGATPLSLPNVHVAIRTAGPDIDARSDRALTFRGRTAVTLGPLMGF